ncbi:hypothetical protein J7K74_03845 [Candidatus Woesearchaeota archaeon]|nr:hypothetical protein [Candidatus Woesearchaeota archaeon]
MLEEARQKARGIKKELYGILYGAVATTYNFLLDKPTTLKSLVFKLQDLFANYKLISEIRDVLVPFDSELFNLLGKILLMIHDRERELKNFLD